MLIFILILVLMLVYFISAYNSFQTIAVRIQEAWSQIDVQLKRRIDLIPNVVETVKGYASHEKDVFENVSKARAALMGAQGPKQVGEADTMLSGALKSLFAVAEAYPELKAQQGFSDLQRELADTEDKVAYSRQFYNSVVKEYNQKILVFPTNIIAGFFKFTAKEFFEATEAEREAVKVDFTSKQ